MPLCPQRITACIKQSKELEKESRQPGSSEAEEKTPMLICTSRTTTGRCKNNNAFLMSPQLEEVSAAPPVYQQWDL